jgi:ribosomal protein L11 methyltransferase
MLASPRMATWSLTAELPAEEADAATAILFERGAAGVEEREAGLAPMPGERQPGAGRVLLVGFFPDRESALDAAGALGVPADLAEIPDRDWGEEWKKGLGPVTVGRLFLRPSWIEAAPPPGAAEVVLDPGMAFGTGTHATTSLCLAAIDAFLARRPGASVLDVGTGSGLLAIAARKLGAGRVAANDNDPIAVAVAAENAGRNGAALELTGDPPSAIPGSFDLVVANILANVLVDLAPDLARRAAPGGEVVLAGVLVPQEAEVAGAFLAQGLEALPGERRGEWSLLRFRRPEGR